MTTKKIIGFPGAGKTTYLMNYVEELLHAGIEPNKIGFYAFTRAAAKEAIDRALTKFPQYEKQNFAHFRTIHSEAARLLELREEEVFVTDKRLQEFCKSINYSYKSKVDPDNPYEWITGRYEAPQVFWEIKSFGVHNRYTLIQAWGNYPSHHYVKARFSEYRAFLDKYSEYKASEGVYDYDDILINVLQEKKRPDIKYLIVDEFQDFSPLLYQIFLQWESSMEEVVIAGDPYQAIYTFMGANPAFLQDHPTDKRIVLPQSHRLPSNLLAFAQDFINDPEFRTVKPVKQGGTIEKYFGKLINLGDQLRQEKGSVFLLTRTNHHLRQLMEELIIEGIPFFTHRGFSPWEDRKTCILHNALVNYSSNEPLSRHETVILLNHFPVKGFLVRGVKAKAKKALKEKTSCDLCFPGSEEVDPKKLRNVFLQKLTFSQLINSLKLGKWRKTALRRKLERSQELIDYSHLSIAVGTIHSVKGREADTVFLFTDITKRIRLWADIKEEQRVWFVGMTRARQKLVLVENRYNKKSRNNYDIPVNLLALREEKLSELPKSSLEKVESLKQQPKLVKRSEIPITPEFWKDYILKVVREAGEEGINREDLREKTRKSIGLGVGYYNRLDILITELLQEERIVEVEKGVTLHKIKIEIDQSERELLYDKIVDLIKSMLDETDNEPISIMDILNRAVDKGLPKDKVNKLINKLIRRGEYFEPHQGFIKRIG